MLFPLIGPSGSGKTTLLKGLRHKVQGSQPLESITTRSPRTSDLDGEYRHVSLEEFERFKQSGAFCWTAEAYGNRYGTRALVVNAALASKTVYMPILTIDTVTTLLAHAEDQGKAHAVKPIYLSIDDTKELRRRLLGRGDRFEEVRKRLHALREERRTYFAVSMHLHAIDARAPAQEVLAEAYAYVMKEKSR